MAQPVASTASQRSPQVVAFAFVQSYYAVLHTAPEEVHKFYDESSILSHPNSEGQMVEVTSLQAIKEKFLSFNFSNYKIVIETVDSQLSYNEGIFIVVSGFLLGADSATSKFTQSFFLIPRGTGAFFVLNDIFRFMSQTMSVGVTETSVNGESDNTLEAPPVPVQEPNLVQENHIEHNETPAPDTDVANQVVENDQSEIGVLGESISETEVTPANSANDKTDHKEQPAPKETTIAVVQENVPKKSFAALVKGLGDGPFKTPTKPKTKASPPTDTKSSPVTAKSAPEAKVNGDSNSIDVEGYSVHIKNLPPATTGAQVFKEFEKFGPIKPNGVQVRNHKVDNFCFGFVEFVDSESMQAAIKASPVTMGNYKLIVEAKKTKTRVVNGVAIISGRGGVVRQASNNFRGGRNGPSNYRRNVNGDNFVRNVGGNNNFRRNDGGTDNFRGNDGFRGNGYQGRGGNFRGSGRSDFRGRGRGRGQQGYTNNYQQHNTGQNGNGAVPAQKQIEVTA